MKNFLRRLKFYGLGFGIGLIFVLFFFQNRGCTWLPSNRVKNTILGRVVVVSEADRERMKAAGVTDKEIIEFLNTGDVDFGASKKQGSPQVYSITNDVNGKETELWFTLPKGSYVAEVQWPEGSIFKAGNTQEGTGRMIHFPNVESLLYLDSNKRLTCQQEKLELIAPAEIQKRLKKTGYVDFSRSDFGAKPFPLHYIGFTTRKGIRVETQTHWYQEHIQIDEFILKDSVNCGGY